MAMLISRRSMVLGATLALPVLGVVGASDLPMLARLIQHPTRHRVSLIHLGWVAWRYGMLSPSGGGNFVSD